MRLEAGVYGPEETLARRQGSCRDSGWLLVQALRHLGFAARFVSGYLIQLKPDLVSLDGPPGTDHDFTDLHAWCEVYLPGAGWIGLDPTSGLLTGEKPHPALGDPAYRNAAPISGSYSGEAKVGFAFDMKVSRIAEHPRHQASIPTRPGNARAASGAVDKSLTENDVRLTMGGEPTFVSIDDFESEEWNTAAVGPTKREKADALIRRLRERFAPNGFLHYGQGKWYPGESLPRWTFSLYWRRDGKPLWKRAELIAKEGEAHAVSAEAGRELLSKVGDALGIGTETIDAAYEDPGDWLLKEAKLPDNVDPLNPELADPEARARMARVFAHGLGTPTGYVLPVQRWNASAATSRWITEKWRTRRGKLFLAAGDSSVGYRLPLGSLKNIPATSYPHVVPLDPLAPRGPLPDPEAILSAPPEAAHPGHKVDPRAQMQSRFTAADRAAADRRAGAGRGPRTCAPRSRPRCARGGSASSCRRSRRSRTISSW